MNGTTCDEGNVAHIFEYPKGNGTIRIDEDVSGEECYTIGFETKYTPIPQGQITENSIRAEHGLHQREAYITNEYHFDPEVGREGFPDEFCYPVED